MRAFGLGVITLAVLGSAGAQADPNPFQVPTYSRATPQDDERALAILAPSSSRATASGTYGDAPLALGYPGGEPARPAHHRSLATRRRDCGALADVRFRCAGPASKFFAREYIYTPSYVSSPQIYGRASGTSPLLPPVTAFFLDPLR